MVGGIAKRSLVWGYIEEPSNSGDNRKGDVSDCFLSRR